MSSVENQGDESDRFIAYWNLVKPNQAEMRPSGSVVLDSNEDGMPIRIPTSASFWIAKLPEDIAAIRAENIDKALAWRYAFRELMHDAQESNYRVAGITQNGQYVFEHNHQPSVS